MENYKFEPVEIQLDGVDIKFDFGKDLDPDRQEVFHHEISAVNTINMFLKISGYPADMKEQFEFVAEELADYAETCEYGDDEEN